MSATRQRGGTNRASARSASNGSTRGRTTKKPSQSNSKPSATQANAKSSASQAHSKTTAANNKGNHEAVTAVGLSLASATVGAVGGVLLGRNALARRRKVPTKIDLSGVGQQIGEAGRQFARLATEVRSVREKAEQIGRILS